MAKKEPKKPVKNIEQPEITPEKFMAEITRGFQAVNKRLDEQDKRINQVTQRSATVAKKASEAPKQIDIMGLVDKALSVFNSPVVQKMLVGEPEAKSNPMGEDEDVKKAVLDWKKKADKYDSIVDRYMEAQVQGLILDNKRKNLEIGSDLG